MRYLYIASADIASITGPGINEREFIEAMSEMASSSIWFIVRNSAAARPRGKHVFSCPFQVGVAAIDFLLHEVYAFIAGLWLYWCYRFDAIAVRPSPMPMAATGLSWLLRLPVVVRIAGRGGMDRLRTQGTLSSVIAPMGDWLLRALLLRAVLIEVVTRTLEQHYRHYTAPSTPYLQLPNGVNIGRFYVRSRAEVQEKLPGLTCDQVHGRTVLCYVGTLEWWTGLEIFLQLLAEPHPWCTSLHLFVLGNGPARQQLLQGVQARGLEGRVSLLGQVPYETVPLYLAWADVGLCVFPHDKMSHTGSSAQKLRQYLACGLPVIASAGDGHDFIGDEGLGWLVQLEKLDSIRAALAAVTALSPEEKQLLRVRTEQYARQHFSTRTLAERRLQAWHEAVSRC